MSSLRSFSLWGLSFFLSSPFHVSLPVFSNAVLLPKSLGALTDGSVENPAMHPNPTVGRPPGQRGRKPGRRKTKVSSPWSQKSSVLGPQSIQAGKGLEPKVPKKRGPKPGSKVGVTRFKGVEDCFLWPLAKNRPICANNFISLGQTLWPIGSFFSIVTQREEFAPRDSCVSFAPCLQLGWAKRAGWLEAVMAGPGRPVTGPGRTRGRLPANWAQRIALQQAQTPADPIKIPKKRGPKPGSKVAVWNIFMTRALLKNNKPEEFNDEHPSSKETNIKCPNVRVCAYTQRKPRVVPNPVPTSPTTSTPEPDTSTVPLDNATIPNSALQAPTGTTVGPVLDMLHVMW